MKKEIFGYLPVVHGQARFHPLSFHPLSTRLRNMHAPSASLGSPAILVIGKVAPLARTDALPPAGRRPGLLTIGLGFRRDVTPGQIEAAVRMALGMLESGDMAEVMCVATLQDKAHEPALLAFCEQHRMPLVGVPAEEIRVCLGENPSLTRSPVAREKLGVAGVCEPCALLAAPGARLLRGKLALDGVTVAIGTVSPMQPDHTDNKQGHHEDR
ncbi:cobalamin biosynthesis protein [Paraburkholderia sp. A1RI-2L]|uniref:cobalamin biosynthesis protein n=1 Tax=Paraburkholderia sp. A1RI-2L TaxID=3028367 RepID=UPI003B76CB89